MAENPMANDQDQLSESELEAVAGGVDPNLPAEVVDTFTGGPEPETPEVVNTFLDSDSEASEGESEASAPSEFFPAEEPAEEPLSPPPAEEPPAEEPLSPPAEEPPAEETPFGLPIIPEEEEPAE